MCDEDKKHFDELYMRVWERCCEHGRIRWTVATFFMSVSFGLFGFSLHSSARGFLPLMERIIAVGIYWFAYAIFMRFHRYTNTLRKYLRKLEDQEKASYDLQSEIDQVMAPRRKWISSERMLLYFGIAYTVAFVLIYLLHPSLDGT